MERLTHRYEDNQAWVSLNLVSRMGENECVGLPITKLAAYEDAEEQDLLVRLPCKVGDSIYSVVEDGLTIIKLKFSLDFYVRRKNDFGKTVFLTREAAEVKLKEMESEKHERFVKKNSRLFCK